MQFDGNSMITLIQNLDNDLTKIINVNSTKITLFNLDSELLQIITLSNKLDTEVG